MHDGFRFLLFFSIHWISRIRTFTKNKENSETDILKNCNVLFYKTFSIVGLSLWNQSRYVIAAHEMKKVFASMKSQS